MRAGLSWICASHARHTKCARRGGWHAQRPRGQGEQRSGCGRSDSKSSRQTEHDVSAGGAAWATPASSGASTAGGRATYPSRPHWDSESARAPHTWRRSGRQPTTHTQPPRRSRAARSRLRTAPQMRASAGGGWQVPAARAAACGSEKRRAIGEVPATPPCACSEARVQTAALSSATTGDSTVASTKSAAARSSETGPARSATCTACWS